MSVKSIDAVDVIKQLRNQTLKEFREYDGSARAFKIYQAVSKAKNGDPCMLTEIAYLGASKSIEKKRESVVLWDATWDI
jgi:hypothetical protein